MKFMGSKRWMLSNGLGDVIRETLQHGNRFIDLFTGSGAVATHVATNFDVSVLAADLQAFSVVLAKSIIERIEPFDPDPDFERWVARAEQLVNETPRLPQSDHVDETFVLHARRWCAKPGLGTLTSAYGGHYFSPLQARWLDSLRATLPRATAKRSVALAALVEGASRCAASPGHTAQPFQPTTTALRFLREAWARDVVAATKRAFYRIASQHAQRLGHAELGECTETARRLRPGDIAFIDPPYSGVHYSRFYHVLESIASNETGKVVGVGRYPDQRFRPVSAFSVKSQAAPALDVLLSTVKSRRAMAIITFPEHLCSNGLSGAVVHEIAARYFKVERHVVQSKFSTLGGTGRTGLNGNDRAARQQARELILSLR